MGKDKKENLILYLGVMKDNTVIASQGNKDSDFDVSAVDALRDMPSYSKYYTLGFDDIMLVFYREVDATFILGCHAILSKEKAKNILGELRTVYSEQTASRGIFRNSEGTDQARKKLEHKMKSFIDLNRGVVPPREDLVIYKDAPGKFLVRQQVEEEVPEGSSTPASVLEAEGRKTLQQELAELGEDESDSEVTSNVPAVKSAPSLPLQSLPPSDPFPFMKARQSQPLYWSVRVDPSGHTVSHSTLQNPASAPHVKGSNVHSGPGRVDGSPVTTVDSEKSDKSSVKSGSSNAVDWTRNRGGQIPEGLDMFSSLKAPKEDSESSPQDSSASESSARRGKKTHPRYAPISSFTDARSSQWAGSRVSPDNLVGREYKTDQFPSTNRPRGFVSERATPVPGRIAPHAPSGLSWEEEIRRLQVAQGFAPPRKLPSINSVSEGGSSESKVKKSPSHNVGGLLDRADRSSSGSSLQGTHRSRSWTSEEKRKSILIIGLIVNGVLLVVCVVVWLALCKGFDCLTR